MLQSRVFTTVTNNLAARGLARFVERVSRLCRALSLPLPLVMAGLYTSHTPSAVPPGPRENVGKQGDLPCSVRSR